MKNGIFMAIVLAVWGFLKLVFKLLKSVIQVLSSLIVFLGLYIPLFYVFFGLILLATTDFTFGGTGTDQMLYYIGLGLCCVASAIITIRNLLIRPISSVFAAFRKEDAPARSRSYRDRDDEYDRKRRYAFEDEGTQRAEYRRRDGACFYREEDDYAYDGPSYRDRSFYQKRNERFPEDRVDGYTSVREKYSSHSSDMSYRETDRNIGAERPLIYYSKRRPGVLVKEYSDRFELFSEDRNGQRYLGTEYKED